MHCIYKPIIKEVLENAAHNKSVIAEMVLKELENNNEMASKKNMNYFDLVITKSDSCMSYQFSACQKDVTNDKFPDKDVPNVMWLDKYRDPVGLQHFISRFQSVRDFMNTDEEGCERVIEYLQNILTLPKLKINIGSNYNSVLKAYKESNYTKYRNDNSLHNSCMRHDGVSKCCAQFYAYLAKCRILYVTDESGKEIYGRSIIWDNILFNKLKETKTLLDRVYYCNSGILKIIYKYASENDFIRKEVNNYSSKENFMFFDKNKNKWESFSDSIEYKINHKDCDKYKFGAPYLDTFTYGSVTSNGEFVLTNKRTVNTSIEFTSTSGQVNTPKICPMCGKPLRDHESMCSSCSSKFNFMYGVLVSKGSKLINFLNIPVEFLTENDELKPTLMISDFLKKLNKNSN